MAALGEEKDDADRDAMMDFRMAMGLLRRVLAVVGDADADVAVAVELGVLSIFDWVRSSLESKAALALASKEDEALTEGATVRLRPRRPF